MKRKLFTFSAAVSLVLFLAACAAWVTSYHWPQLVYYEWLLPGPPTEIRTACWMSDNGRTYVTIDRTIADSQKRADGWLSSTKRRGFQKVAFTRHSPLRGITDGFRYRWIQEQDKPLELSIAVYTLGVPYWFCFIAFAVLPLTWLLQHRRWREAERRCKGLCLACGYDLRATPGRCPECGREAASDLV